MRALRQCAVYDTTATYLVRKDSNFSVFLNSVVSKIVVLHLQSELFVKILLQVVLNLLSGEIEESKKLRREVLRSQLNISEFIGLNVFPYEISALLYNAYYDQQITEENLLKWVFKAFAEDMNHTNEYLDMLMGKIISESQIWEQFPQLPSSHRLQILIFLQEALTSPDKNTLIIKVNPPQYCLQCLARTFSNSGSIIFQTTPNNTDSIKEVLVLLQVLAHLSSEELHLKHLSNDKDLLINCGVLLINAHQLGKCEGSVFTPMQKLEELQNPSEDLRGSLVFGFKADLIRLIANLCWRNRVMQELAREAELIPVLLDCCNMDAKNPFIIQWAILAIRNICENNRENQLIIGGLTQKKFISSEILENFGVKLHNDGKHSTGIILDTNKR
ncbi:ataxin-10 isoform X2 [Euwallacea fornicatus]